MEGSPTDEGCVDHEYNGRPEVPGSAEMRSDIPLGLPARAHETFSPAPSQVASRSIGMVRAEHPNRTGAIRITVVATRPSPPASARPRARLPRDHREDLYFPHFGHGL